MLVLALPPDTRYGPPEKLIRGIRRAAQMSYGLNSPGYRRVQNESLFITQHPQQLGDLTSSDAIAVSDEFPDKVIHQVSKKYPVTNLIVIGGNVQELPKGASGYVPSRDEILTPPPLKLVRAVNSQTRIEHLALFMSERTFNLLKREKFEFLWELRRKGEKKLLKIEGLGPKSLQEIKTILSYAYTGKSFMTD